ncbi:MAG: glycosyltransferase family 4 protein [Clostridiaceae bacterium]|nr:glycosyltransferase family 4 protein [Clostridiaceae bacterium]
MDRKRILIVSASFYPQISPRAFRTTELAKEFARRGHEVVVLIPFKGYDYSDYAKENKLIIKNLGDLRFPDIKLKGGRLQLLFRRGIRRMLSLLFEYPDIELMFLVSRHLKLEKGFDLLISIAVPYPIHWGVAKARTVNNRIAKTWIADCGDPYMGCTTDSFKKFFYFKYIEKWHSRKCDYITIPFDTLRDKFYPEFHEKLVVIPQGFKIEEIKLSEVVNNKVPTFAFAGSIIPGIRDLNLFFEFLKEIKSEYKFVVYTRQTDYFIKYKSCFKEHLEIKEYLPRLQLLYELSKCDFLVNVDTIYDCQSVNTAFPSKLIDYSFTGRPILNICSNLIDKAAVIKFLSGNYENRRRVNNNNYKIEVVAASFFELSDISKPC